MNDLAGRALTALLFLIVGYLFGHHAGLVDARADLGVYEDGSYEAGCIAGAPCDDHR